MFLLFYFSHGGCSNNYFEYDTFCNSFIVWFCWNLLALAIIYTSGKERFKEINKINKINERSIAVIIKLSSLGLKILI